MNYETSVQFHGDAGKALDFVATTLVSNGFNLVERTATTLTATGPPYQSGRTGGKTGFRSEHDRQSPLVFIKKIEVRASGGSLSARGRISSAGTYLLGGVLSASALGCVACAVVMFMGMKDDVGRTAPRWAGFLALGMGVFLFAKLPSLLRYINHLGWDALDALVNNAAATASR